MRSLRHVVLAATLSPAALLSQARPALRLSGPPTIPPLVLEEAQRIANAPTTTQLTPGATIAATETVATDACLVQGRVTIAGRITGTLVAINADVTFLPGARVEGRLVALGGSVAGLSNATIGQGSLLHADSVTVQREGEENEDQRWWQRRQRWRSRRWSELRFVSARTYNRVEGLPVLLGPAFGTDLGWGRLTLDAAVVLRSVGKWANTPDNLGHAVRTELRFGRDYGVRVGARVFDIVETMEPWTLSETERGLAAFLLRRDFADYFNTHGGALFAGVFVRRSLEGSVAYSDERWASRSAHNALSLFRNNQPWRENPLADQGTFHRVQLAARYDTRNERRDPWSGWFATADYEFGVGTTSAYAPMSTGVRSRTAGGRTEYDRLMLDVRRYNRLSPDAQLNLRLVSGGWLSGDALPLQRRLSVGGPGTLPGYAFREVLNGTDVLQCTADASGVPDRVAGTPAQCDRIMLAQLELRGDLRIDPFDFFSGERRQRRHGWGRSAEWVVFADAGRGWLVGAREGRLRYPSDMIPALGSFRSDVGVGLRLDDLGLYVARGVSEGGRPYRFFVRLRPRF